LNDRGNGEEYLLRRLKKHDAEHGTDFAGKWARDEITSIRQAAIAAGIEKPKVGGRPLKKKESPEDMVRLYWNRATKAQRKRIAALIRNAGLEDIK
jgi:hypothetical protein